MLDFHEAVDKLYVKLFERIGLVLVQSFLVLDDGTPVIREDVSLHQAEVTLLQVRAMLTGFSFYRVKEKEIAPHLEWVEQAINTIHTTA